MITVKQLREIAEDCWFEIIECQEGAPFKSLFMEDSNNSVLSSKYANCKVDWFAPSDDYILIVAI